MSKVRADLLEAIARSNVPVQKLPPGQAEGADDLRRWSSRRLAGKFGVTRRPLVRVRCSECGWSAEMDLPPDHVVLKCRRWAGAVSSEGRRPRDELPCNQAGICPEFR
jgi:hypothetical protein